MTTTPEGTGAATHRSLTPERPRPELIDVREWLGDTLWSSRSQILGSTAATLVVAFSIAWILPAQFEARASVMNTATPAKMEVIVRIAKSTEVIGKVLDQARKQKLIEDGEITVLLADPDTEHPSNPTPLLTLRVRTRRADSAQPIAELWVQQFIGAASGVDAQEQGVKIPALQRKLAAAAAAVDNAETELERVTAQTAREQAALEKTLNLVAKRRAITLLEASLREINRRALERRLVRESLAFETSNLGSEIALGNSNNRTEPPPLRSPAVLTSLVQSEQADLDNARRILTELGVTLSKLTAEAEALDNELKLVPQTNALGQAEHLRDQLNRRLTNVRIELRSAAAQRQQAEAEVRDRQAQIDRLSSELYTSEVAAAHRQGEADLAAAVAEERKLGGQLDALIAEVAAGELRLSEGLRDVTRRRERSAGELGVLKGVVQELTRERAAALNTAESIVAPRLVAIEGPTQIATVRYVMAAISGALAFGIAIAVVTVRRHLRSPAA